MQAKGRADTVARLGVEPIPPGHGAGVMREAIAFQRASGGVTNVSRGTRVLGWVDQRNQRR